MSTMVLSVRRHFNKGGMGRTLSPQRITEALLLGLGCLWTGNWWDHLSETVNNSGHTFQSQTIPKGSPVHRPGRSSSMCILCSLEHVDERRVLVVLASSVHTKPLEVRGQPGPLRSLSCCLDAGVNMERLVLSLLPWSETVVFLKPFLSAFLTILAV